MKIFAILAFLTLWLGAEGFEGALNEAQKLQSQERRSQEKVATLDDASASLYEQYRTLIQEQERVRAYNEQMTRMVESQEREMGVLDEQIEEIDHTAQALMPLMQRMIATLDEFVGLDTPFLMQERRTRVEGLRSMMDEASISMSEKYRKVMEAYMSENEYARTVEVYREALSLDGETKTVDMLRIGRLSLYYRSIDGAQSGIYNPATKRFEPLSSDYAGPLKSAMLIAKKQAAPDLMRLPIVKTGGSK